MTTYNKIKNKGLPAKTVAGFTIVESLVAISILILAITGAASAIQTGISSYIFSKDQIIAFYLAQEGFEQIRNLRDENRLENQFWLSGISENASDPCYFGNACIVDPVLTDVPTRCGAPGSCEPLRQDPANGFYGYHPDWPESIFTREIVLTEVPGTDDEISIEVTVYWSKGIVDRQFHARENLFKY